MQVLRDHELVLSCTRNLVLVFSIVILLTTQDVSGESILSQSWEKETWWHNQRFPSQEGLSEEKDNFHNSFHNSLLLIFTYILQDTSLQKWNISLFLISFCLFIGSYYTYQCIRLHFTPISHIFFIVHFNTSFSFHKVYLLFTNLKFKKRKKSFSFSF